MFLLHKFFSVGIITLLSIIFYLISKNAGILQENITGKFNSFQSFIFEINHLSSALSPLLIFTFIYTTSYVVLTHLEILNEKISLSKIITSAFIPILLFSIIYLILINNFVSNIEDLSNKNIKNLKLIFDYTFNDFKYVGYLFWGLFYLILFIEIKRRYEVSYWISIVTTFMPGLFLLMLIQLI